MSASAPLEQSALDENFWFWKTSAGALKALMTTHVDDLAATAGKQILDSLCTGICKEFGQATRQLLPFTHCGSRYSRIPAGVKIDQEEFCMNLNPVMVEDSEDDERDLLPAEVVAWTSSLTSTTFRHT